MTRAGAVLALAVLTGAACAPAAADRGRRRRRRRRAPPGAGDRSRGRRTSGRQQRHQRRPPAIGPPQTVVAKTLKQSAFGAQPLIQATLAPNGTATVLYVEPTDLPPPAPSFALKAADGS